MVKKLEIKTVPVPNNPTLVKDVGMDNESLFDKINELVDAVNEIMTWRFETDEDSEHKEQPDAKSRPEKVQDPVCFISTTYPSDNQTTVFLGQKGASVEFNQPLPAGFIITIKEN